MKNLRIQIANILEKICKSSDYSFKDQIFDILVKCYRNQDTLEELLNKIQESNDQRKKEIDEKVEENPNYIGESNEKIVEMRKNVELEIKAKAEEARVKQQEIANRMKIEEEKRLAFKEAESQAKVDNGLIFGNWEIIPEPIGLYKKGEVIQIKHKKTTFSLYYYIEEDKMGFKYPYNGEVKNFMKEILGMRWVDEMWITKKYVSAIHKLTKQFEGNTEFYDSIERRGLDHKKYTVENSFLNIFSECSEVIEHLAQIYLNVQKHVDDFNKKQVPPPSDSENQTQQI